MTSTPRPPTSTPQALAYAQSGVSRSVPNLLKQFQANTKSLADPNLLAGIGPFSAVYQLSSTLSGLKQPLVLASCDGVGTKLVLADEWKDVSGIGQDLVAMNANDLLCSGAWPLLFLDYFACSALTESTYLAVLESIGKACQKAGCLLVGGETAQMPGVYAEGKWDLAGFGIGFLDKDSLLGPHRVENGDVLVGLPSSGFHSNGYTLLRSWIHSHDITPEAKPAWSSDRTWKDLLLAPTLLYKESVLPLVPKLHSAAHITGGGLFENLERVIPNELKAIVRSHCWPQSDLFAHVQKDLRISQMEMLSTFNCGIGMILLAPESEADFVVEQTHGLYLGHIVKNPSASATARVEWE